MRCERNEEEEIHEESLFPGGIEVPEEHEMTPARDPFEATALGARSVFRAPDFVFDLRGSKPDSTGVGGTIRPLTVSQLPSLKNQVIN